MLSDALIKKLPVPKQRREVPDGKIGGLYLILQPSGAKSWAVRYRADGISRKLTLGSYPAVDLATARKRALEALGDVAGGKDPAAVKIAARDAARSERETQIDRVERVVEMFIERHAKPKTSDWRETERMLVNEVVKRWKGKRLSSITRAHVHEMLDEIVDRGAPVRANRVFAQFRKMCRWALSREIIDRSPCDGLMAPSPEKKRDRVLSDDEIVIAWRSFESIGWPFGHIGMLLLATGARLREVAEMTWSEIDLTGRKWNLRKERTKNKRPHEIPLSDTAVAILEGSPRIGGGTVDFIFTTTGRTAVSGFSKAKTAVDKAMMELLRERAEAAGADPKSVKPIERWTFHDARRTFATNMQKLGVKLEVTEVLLNHISGTRSGIIGVYQIHQYEKEKREAIDMWGRRLDALVSGAAPANIVMKTKARG